MNLMWKEEREVKKKAKDSGLFYYVGKMAPFTEIENTGERESLEGRQ